MTESRFCKDTWAIRTGKHRPALCIETDDKWLINTILGAIETKILKHVTDGEFEDSLKYNTELIEMANAYTKLEEYESKVIDDESLPEV